MTDHHNVQFAEPLDLVMNFISATFLNLMKVSSLPETTLQPISMLKSNKLILQKQKFKSHCKRAGLKLCKVAVTAATILR